MAKKLNGRANCVLEVCCEPGSPEHLAALEAAVGEALDGVLAAAGVAMLGPSAERHGAIRDVVARGLAAWIDESVDLAPKGSLVAFKKEIARLAREPRDH